MILDDNGITVIPLLEFHAYTLLTVIWQDANGLGWSADGKTLLVMRVLDI